MGYDSSKTLFESAEFANFQWAFTAPSYVQPLYNMKSQKNGFVVGDVIYGKTASLEDIQFFINKVSIIRSYKRLPHFLPVLLLDNATPEALKVLKEHKVVIAFIKNLFDQRYVELLAEIVNIFTNASAIIAKDPAQIEKLFSEISKSEGRYNDIIGDFFEIMVGYYYQCIGCRYLTIGKTIVSPRSGKPNELDLLVEREGKVIIVECKATRSAVDEKYVERWLGKNIPQTREWLNERYPDIGCFEFQLWSLGGFSPNALNMLKDAKDKTKKYRIEFFNKEDILEKIKQHNVQHLADLLRKHF